MFSKDMVEAILQGRKTQTRRIIKDSFNGCWAGSNGSIQPGGHPCPNDPVVMHPGELIKDYEGQYHQYEAEVVEAWFHCSTMDKLAKCPYGKMGDILYGKETFFAYGHWTKITDTETGKSEWKFNDLTRDEGFTYRYFDNPPDKIYKRSQKKLGWHKRPSLFMPKGAARIWLQITDIRVERLMSISEGDAIAEGIEEFGGFYRNYSTPDMFPGSFSAMDSYLSLWDSINGKDSHKINPWVWVIEFENVGFEKAAMLLSHGEKALK